MRSAVLPISLIILIFSALIHPQAAAQSSSNMEKGSPQRWMSHQMLQPPPGDLEKSNISKDMIEEIRRLYLEAEKEIQGKSRSRTHQQEP